MESTCGFMVLIFTIVNIRMVTAATPELQKAVLGNPVKLIYRSDIHNTSGVMLTNSDKNQSDYVFLCHDICPDPTHQNPIYRDQVELDDRQITDGTLVFTLRNMSRSFEGKYYCYVFQNGDRILIGIIELRAEDSGGRNMKDIILSVISVVVVIIIIIIIIIVCKHRKSLMEKCRKLYQKSCPLERETVV